MSEDIGYHGLIMRGHYGGRCHNIQVWVGGHTVDSFLRRQVESRWRRSLRRFWAYYVREPGHREVAFISLLNMILRSRLVFPTIYLQAADLDFEPRDSHAQRDGASCGYTKNTALCPSNALLSDGAMTVAFLESDSDS